MKNKTITLLKKEYHGFEDFYDYFRDVSEICEFPEDKQFSKVKGEFNGTIKVTVEFEPADDDMEAPTGLEPVLTG